MQQSFPQSPVSAKKHPVLLLVGATTYFVDCTEGCQDGKCKLDSEMPDLKNQGHKASRETIWLYLCSLTQLCRAGTQLEHTVC